MKRLAWFILAMGVLAQAQTSVTATIKDSDGTVWAGGTYQIVFYPTKAAPGLPSGSQAEFHGNLDTLGSFSVSLPSASASGGSWTFAICPNASDGCGSATIAISGTSQVVSTQLNAAIQPPRFPAVSGNYGYNDTEISPSPSVGSCYFNVTYGGNRCWNGTTWNSSSGTTFTRPVSSPDGQMAPSGANWYVDGQNGNDSNTGLSPNNAFKTIRRALSDNQMLYSQQFDASVWIKTAATITANVATPGDGTVDAIIPSTANSAHQVLQSYTTAEGTFSVCVGPDGYSAVGLQWAGYGIGFNLSTGTTFTLTGHSTPTSMYGMIPASTGACGPYLTSAANWYRIWVNGYVGSTSMTINVLNGTTGGTTFAGDGTSGLYLWGAEGETVDVYAATGPGPYVQTAGFPVYTLQSNQTVAINGGNTLNSPIVYRESIYPNPAVVSGLTLQGYGSNRPVIAADNLITPANWTLTAGTTYQVSLPIYLDAGQVNEWVNVFEDGTLMYPMATSLANCEATPGTYYIAGNGAGSIANPFTLYVNLADGSNPNTHTMEYSAREFAISYNANGSFGINLNHLVTRREIAANGSIQIGDHSSLNDFFALQGTKHNMFIGQNSTMTNSGASEAYFNNSGTSLIVVYDNTASGGSFTGTNISCYNPVRSNVTVYNAQVGCFYAHQGTGNMGPFTINGINCVNMVSCLDGEPSQYTISNLTCMNCSQGVVTYEPTTITNSTIYATANTGGQAVGVSLTSTPVAISISNSTLIGNGANGVIGSSSPASFTLTNNYISSVGGGGGLVKLNASAGASSNNLTQSGNTFDTSSGSYPYYAYYGLGTYSSDYNHFLRLASATSGNAASLNQVNYTLQQLQTTFSQELHSTYP